ncbi:MAG: LysM peptidoglycan-binding domain-containing protein, partial [Planctomycetes bacterium]|nr:LysM peptidoglycan-binding domain-containing protein [Planctomycetota bacterium]
RPLLFWHPLYWWLQRKLRFTGELLADDAAARGSVAQYVRCMMTLSTHPDPVAGDMLATTIFRRRSELFRRLEMMLQRDETISRTPSRAGRLVRAATTTLLVGLCAGAFGVERAAAQDPVKRDARREVRALKKELARLRAEIVTLQAQANLGASGVTDTADAPSGFGGFPTVEVGGGSGGAIRSNGRRATTYTVQAGDTLAQIARRCYGDTSKVDRIMRSNPDLDPRRLKVGQRITIHGAQPRVTGMQGSTGAGLAAPRAPRASGVAGVAVTAPSPTAEPTQPGLATAPQPEVDPVQAPPPPPPTGAFGSRPARSPAPGAGLVTGGGRRTAPAPATAGMTAANPSPAPQPRRAPASRSLSGLAELVTRCIELKGDVDIAKVKVEGADSEPDRKIAIIRLRTKERQYEAVRSMLHGELESAEMELEHTAKLHEKGFVSQRELRAAERRIALLRQALK